MLLALHNNHVLFEMTAEIVPVTFHLASGRVFVLLNCMGVDTETGAPHNPALQLQLCKKKKAIIIIRVILGVCVYVCVGICKIYNQMK